MFVKKEVDILGRVWILTSLLPSCVAFEKSVTLSGPQLPYLWNSGTGVYTLSSPTSSGVLGGEWILGSRVRITNVFYCFCVAINNKSRTRSLQWQKHNVFFVFLKGGWPVTYWLSFAGILGESSFYIYFCISLAISYLSSSNFVTHFGLKSERASIYLSEYLFFTPFWKNFEMTYLNIKHKAQKSLIQNKRKGWRE